MVTSQSEKKEAVLEKFRVESITEGALRAIARKGGAATMQDIADESGIAKGTLYLYFKDRDELLQRVSHAGLTQLLQRIEEVFDRKLPFDETIRALILTKLRFFDERRDLYRVHFEIQFSPSSDPDCKIPSKRTPPPEKQAYVDRITRYFREEMEDAEDAPKLARYFAETLMSLLFKRIPETNGSKLESDAEFLSDMMLNGFSGKRKKS